MLRGHEEDYPYFYLPSTILYDRIKKGGCISSPFLIGISLFLFVWFLLEVILSSPFGRVLRAIREDEEVAQHHGYDVLKFKAMSLALGAGIAALAGALWKWLNGINVVFE